MKFGEMLEIIRDGASRAFRKGWHGKGMWIYVEKGKVIPYDVLREPQKTWFQKKEIEGIGDSERVKMAGFPMIVKDHLNLFTDGYVIVGWLASQSDILADDWEILVN